MQTATIKNFHLPLPASLYARLRQAAARAGTPATGLAREAIEAWLKDEHRRQQRQELSDFVEVHAGTDWDCDPEWEAAGVESMNKMPASSTNAPGKTTVNRTSKRSKAAT